jgi:hypothetical protein
MDRSGRDFHACKPEQRRYTQSGHHAIPFAIQVPLAKELDAPKAA